MLYRSQVIFILLLVTLSVLTSCEEDVVTEAEVVPTLVVSPDILPPTLSTLAESVSSIVKFGVAVDTSQAQDTVYYAVFDSGTAPPEAPALIDQDHVIKFLMGGNAFRPAYQPALSKQAEYVVYAVIKRGRRVSETARLDIKAAPIAAPEPGEEGEEPVKEEPAEEGPDTPTDGDPENPDEPDNNNPDPDPEEENPDDGGGKPEGTQPTLVAPILEPRGVPQRNLISMAIMVASDQIGATVHYTFFKESKHQGAPTPQELLDDSFKTFDMNGAVIKTFNFGASSQTKYYIYALIQIENEVSEVVLLEATTE